MTTMPKPQRFCIYCNGPGLTHEHMWADWLRHYIPRTKTQHGYRKQIVFPEKIQQSVYYKTGDAHARRIRRVCLSCNTGWMSRLQEAARPHLEPMLEGRKVSLHRKAQTTLAAWVAMMVMTAEFVDDAMVAIPADERQFLMERRRPKGHWQIWLSVSQNPLRDNQQLWFHNVMTLMKEGDDPACYSAEESNTQTSTICLGNHLIVHVMSSKVAQSILRRWVNPKAVAPALVRIWPIRTATVIWPPSRGLTEAGIHFVANDLFNRVDRKARRDAGLPPDPLPR